MSLKLQKIMSLFRNKNFLRLALVALLTLLLATVLAACSKQRSSSETSAPIYDINAYYDADSHTLSARQEVLVDGEKYIHDDNLTFRLYANAFCDDNDAIDILSVKINRQNADFELCGDKNTVLRVPVKRSSGLVSVSMQYNVYVPTADARLGCFEGGASLCDFYPSLAVYDGTWREDEPCSIGDPFLFECADLYVTLTLDAELAVAGSGVSGAPTFAVKDGKRLKTVEFSAENIRDFGLVVGNFSTQSTTARLSAGDVDVNYFYITDAEPAAALERAANALTLFDEAFGEYPYPCFTLVERPLDGAGGMEYSALALVSPSPSEVLLDAVTHEVAHQWWYGAVGSDQLNCAWLDEGLSEFCTYFYLKLAGDPLGFSAAIADIRASYEDFVSVMRPVGFDASLARPLSSFLSSGEYVAVAYQKGALLFHHLYSVVGEKSFTAALKEYCSANKFAIATPSCLAAAFKTQGFDVAPILDGWIYDSSR